MLIPTLLIGALLVVTMVVSFVRYKDTFHPALLMGPMIGFHYFYSPLMMQASSGFFGYLTDAHVSYAQWVHLVGVLALCLGLLTGSLQTRPPAASTKDLAALYDTTVLRKASFIMAGLGIASFVYGIVNVGGWSSAYGSAYGGGSIESGWVRDLVLLCLPALMLFTLSEGDQPVSRRQLILALPMVAPFLIHGLIGARRGPTFMTFAGAAMVFYMARQRRPKLLTLAVGGGLVGCLMLALVANRNSIYWGSEKLNVETVDTDTSAFLRGAEGNDYIYGAGLVIVTDELHDFSWGTTYLTTLLVRPIPRAVWPTKYEDAAEFFGRPILTQNLGVDITSFRDVLGWKASVGAAPGIIGDMWREFSWGMVLVLFGIAFFYSYAWWRAVSQHGAWVAIYCLAASLVIYLVMQTLEAMLYRFLFGLVPMLFVLRYSAKKAREKAERATLAEAAAVSTLAPSS